MKKIWIVFSLLAFLSFTSCEMISGWIPDVEKKESETFPILISQNISQDETEAVFVDITDSEDYDDYKKRITGYEIQKITYEILDYKGPLNPLGSGSLEGPDNLNFSGEILVSESEKSGFISVGEIIKVNLKSISKAVSETTVYEGEEGYETIVDWLMNPGSFYYKLRYKFTDESGVDYNFGPEELGTNFSLELHFYLIVYTGI